MNKTHYIYSRMTEEVLNKYNTQELSLQEKQRHHKYIDKQSQCHQVTRV